MMTAVFPFLKIILLKANWHTTNYTHVKCSLIHFTYFTQTHTYIHTYPRNITTVKIIHIAIIFISFLVPLCNLPRSSFPGPPSTSPDNQSQICFLSTQVYVSLHVLEFYILELYSMFSFLVSLYNNLGIPLCLLISSSFLLGRYNL